MNKLCVAAIGLILTVNVYAGDGGHDHHVMDHKNSMGHKKVHWTYTGAGAPGHWGELSPEFSDCKAGKKQSPININSGQAKKEKLAKIKFNYKKSPTRVVNNGHTIKVEYGSGSSITVGKKTYELLQFHFHSPSEHTVDGAPFDMVAHLVHKAKDGQLGVIAVLMKADGKDNKIVKDIWSKMPKGMGDSDGKSLNVAALLPKDKTYYNYVGSLTTPPCSEGVNWMVLKNPVSISANQVKQFTQLFPVSVRPTQALNGRITKLSE